MQDTLILNESFSTYDISLSTAISIWLPIEKVDKSQNPHKVLFVFHRSPELDELVSKYWKKELLVEPRQFFDQLKALKGRIFSNE